jgi:hypothetical protein
MNDAGSRLIAELNMLLRLTRMEAWTARVRRVQASDEKVARRLTDLADEARHRAADLQAMIGQLGGPREPIGAVLFRAAVLARVPLEQALPLQEVLLSDLMLQEQLRDRAGYVRAVAERAGRPEVVALMNRFEESHRAGIEWIKPLLAGIGAGEQPGLRPSPTQQLADIARRTNWLVASAAARAVREAGSRLRRSGRDLQDSARVLHDDLAGRTPHHADVDAGGNPAGGGAKPAGRAGARPQHTSTAAGKLVVPTTSAASPAGG